VVGRSALDAFFFDHDVIVEKNAVVLEEDVGCLEQVANHPD
jgi:hypothetical protein